MSNKASKLTPEEELPLLMGVLYSDLASEESFTSIQVTETFKRKHGHKPSTDIPAFLCQLHETGQIHRTNDAGYRFA